MRASSWISGPGAVSRRRAAHVEDNERQAEMLVRAYNKTTPPHDQTVPIERAREWVGDWFEDPGTTFVIGTTGFLEITVSSNRGQQVWVFECDPMLFGHILRG